MVEELWNQWEIGGLTLFFTLLGIAQTTLEEDEDEDEE